MTTKAKLWAKTGKFTPKPGYRKQTKIWTTGTGHKVRICDMATPHIINSARLLKRTAEIAYDELMPKMYAGYCMLHGEMATYYAEQEISQAEEEGPEGLLPDIYHNLIEELERRGINAEKEI